MHKPYQPLALKLPANEQGLAQTECYIDCQQLCEYLDRALSLAYSPRLVRAMLRQRVGRHLM